MLEHAREAHEMARCRTRASLDQDRQFALAAVRLLEVIGEAAARIPEDLRACHDDVPWRDITDMRNRLIHGYDAINHDLVWDVLTLDLPSLIAQLETILSQEQ